MDQGNIGEADEYLKHLSVSLHSSSTLRRRTALQGLKQRIPGELCGPPTAPDPLTLWADLSENEPRVILTVLSRTYPAYHNRASRQLVQECISSLLSAHSDCLQQLGAFLKIEATKPGLSPSSVFVLIEWSSLALQVFATDRKRWDTLALDLVAADAQLLELCASQETKASVKNSALIVTRRALRKVFRAADLGGEAVKAIVTRLAQKNNLAYKNAVLLGTVADVCARLMDARPILESLKPHFFSFWVREVIGSKTIVPNHIAAAFHDFFHGFTTLQDLQTEIVPALEKALLRAPEVVLNDLVRPMVGALPTQIDLSEILANRLLKPLLSNLKSTNADIRNGACLTFIELIGRCYDEGLLERIGRDILSPLITSKIASADQRIVHARMLSSMPFHATMSVVICEGLSNVIAKEPNEAAAAAEGTALVRHMALIISRQSSTLDKCFPVFVKGLDDKRPAFRRMWVLKSGDLLWQILQAGWDTPQATDVANAIVPKLLDLFTEVVASPLPATQSGLVVAGYVVVSLCDMLGKIADETPLKGELQKADVIKQTLAIGAKPSFLLSPKVYTKTASQEDLTWFVRSTFACSREVVLKGPSSSVGEAWAQTLLFTIMASHVPHDTQLEAKKLLTLAYKQHPREISRLVIAGLWNWFRSIENGVKDSAVFAAQTGLQKCHLVIRCICLPPNGPHDGNHGTSVEVLQPQLIDMLVLCRPEVLPRANWIELCLRVGQDPGSLVKAQSIQCIEKVNEVLNDNTGGPPSATTKLAAYKTFAELAFVAPETITPLLVSQIAADLSVEDLRQYGPTEFAIARTPEGTAFVDVLSTKAPSKILDKSARDYDTLKWEEEVRNQLALKKGQQKKLTPDEQAKVNSQLVKEAGIKEKVLGLEQKLERGIGMIHGLATGPPTEADMWMGSSLRALLDVIEAGVGLLLGDAADKVYLACANFVSSRLGTMRPFIGVATLRALGSSHLSEELIQEPLGGA